MPNVRDTIVDILTDIQQQSDLKPMEIKDDMRVVADLGLSSMDVAQLIANLEIELGVDPFSSGTSLMDVNTVGELCELYEKSVH